MAELFKEPATPDDPAAWITRADPKELLRLFEAGRKLGLSVNWWFSQRTVEALEELREVALAFGVTYREVKK